MVSHNRRGCEGRGGGYVGGRGYGLGDSPRNVNELNDNNSGGHGEGQQVGQLQGQERRKVHSGNKGGRNVTGFGRGAFN